MGKVLFRVRVKPIYSSKKTYARTTMVKVLRNGNIALKPRGGLTTKLWGVSTKRIENSSISRITYKNAHTGILTYQRSLTIEMTNGDRVSFRLQRFANRMNLENLLAEIYGNRFSQA